MNEIKLNVGCGASPLSGWVNIDNSMSLILAKHPLIGFLLKTFGLLNPQQAKLMDFFRLNKVQYSRATYLPAVDNSVSIIYSSHMMEHLDRDDAIVFLREAFRVLAVGGCIRLCLPDIHKLCTYYLEHGDAEIFVEQTLLSTPAYKSNYQKLKFFIIGPRHHLWMYDAKSLAKLLLKVGFRQVKTLNPGETSILNFGEGINLFEHDDHSFYVEAIK